ncbi:NAD-dependent epimerase/dehydratase family protein [Caldivirga maquilingensis]|uniref:NAD-dependent epimerase/dehydratase n=1 Tax=Caldivirga maquilingensis (strain ATCC 700844 / DSM 13496 / JCM 10307 / IC-167) TaxID=397948 RepID=A8MC26_CALMQ|nr:NAD-dependent epimerase/dehydratase family protein [Caldivirga maquilingensis]ABW02810.1 NAD-dependent epimerase/dehydratase [Caldivirga maquilingensis IC-167]
MVKFLVLGLGFIATHVAEGLSKIGQVTVTYRSLNGVNEVYAKVLRGSVELTRLNPLTDEDELRGLIKNSDTVINLIGALGNDAQLLRTVHVVIPRQVASLIAEYSPSTMLVHVSASNVMGPIGKFINEEPKHCEGARPSTPYEETKCLGEQVVYSMSQSAGFPLAIIRPTLVYGKYNAHPQFLQIYNMAKRGIVPRINVKLMAISAVKLTELIARLHELRPRGLYLYATECEPVEVTRFFEVMVKALGRRPLRIPVPNALLKLALPSDIKPLFKYVNVVYSCLKAKEIVGDLGFMESEVYENALFIKQYEDYITV